MKVNFTPGPSQLYFTVEDHIRTALREQIPSLSHRSAQFEAIYYAATSGIKKLLGIPDHFKIVFTSSATEIWERSIENLVEHDSLHFVNGSFSSRYHEIALQLGRVAQKIEAPDGQAFKAAEIDATPELVALTHNETSTGVSLSNDFINRCRKKYPDSLIVVDAVSSLPYPDFDFTKIDSLFFSVQKGFGLPAGLGVWIVNERCVEKSNTMLARGKSIGSYHSLPTLLAHAQKNQTPETPNVLAIYLLSKVVEDFIRRGITTIRRETEYKAASLYLAMANNKYMKPFVADADAQSKTVIVGDCGENIDLVTAPLRQRGLYPGDGYGKSKKTQLRFANFPAHSKEVFDLLSDTLGNL